MRFDSVLNLDVILCGLAQVDAAVAKAPLDEVLVLGALLVVLTAGLVVCDPDLAVPGEHVELIQINGVFVRGWGGTCRTTWAWTPTFRSFWAGAGLGGREGKRLAREGA